VKACLAQKGVTAQTVCDSGEALDRVQSWLAEASSWKAKVGQRRDLVVMCQRSLGEEGASVSVKDVERAHKQVHNCYRIAAAVLLVCYIFSLHCFVYCYRCVQRLDG
jgi:hypothetical protein